MTPQEDTHTWVTGTAATAFSGDVESPDSKGEVYKSGVDIKILARDIEMLSIHVR